MNKKLLAAILAGVIVTTIPVTFAKDTTHNKQFQIERQQNKEEIHALHQTTRELFSNIGQVSRESLKELRKEFNEARNQLIQEARTSEEKTKELAQNLHEDLIAIRAQYVTAAKEILPKDLHEEFDAIEREWLRLHEERFSLCVNIAVFRLEKYSLRTQKIAANIHNKLSDIEMRISNDKLIPIYEKVITNLEAKINEMPTTSVEPLKAIIDMLTDKLHNMESNDIDIHSAIESLLEDLKSNATTEAMEDILDEMNS